MKGHKTLYPFIIILFFGLTSTPSADVSWDADFLGEDGEGYCFIRPLGRGGMGEVWEAIPVEEPLSLKLRASQKPPSGVLPLRFGGDMNALFNRGKPVALKIPVDQNGLVTDASLDAAYQEIQMLSNLRNRGVRNIPIIKKHTDQQTDIYGSYYTMEIIRGTSLFDIPQKEWTLKKLLKTYIQVAQTLENIHRAGVVHRDIKPENIMIDESGRVIIIDFGLALDLAEYKRYRELKFPKVPWRLEPIWDLTEIRYGTPYYMPGDYVDEGRISFSMDVHALAASMYVNLLGRYPTNEIETVKIFQEKVQHKFLPMPLEPPSQVEDEMSYLKVRGLIHTALGEFGREFSAKMFKLRLQAILKELEKSSP